VVETTELNPFSRKSHLQSSLLFILLPSLIKSLTAEVMSEETFSLIELTTDSFAFALMHYLGHRDVLPFCQPSSFRRIRLLRLLWMNLRTAITARTTLTGAITNIAQCLLFLWRLIESIFAGLIRLTRLFAAVGLFLREAVCLDCLALDFFSSAAFSLVSLVVFLAPFLDVVFLAFTASGFFLESAKGRTSELQSLPELLSLPSE